MESLRGYGTAVVTWLHDLLPARLTVGDLQTGLESTGMAWRGVGNEAITVGYPEDLELLSQTVQAPPFANAFQDPNARYSFEQIADATSQSASALNEHWWQAVWDGQIAGDSSAPLQQANERK